MRTRNGILPGGRIGTGAGAPRFRDWFGVVGLLFCFFLDLSWGRISPGFSLAWAIAFDSPRLILIWGLLADSFSGTLGPHILVGFLSLQGIELLWRWFGLSRALAKMGVALVLTWVNLSWAILPMVPRSWGFLLILGLLTGGLGARRRKVGVQT